MAIDAFIGESITSFLHLLPRGGIAGLDLGQLFGQARHYLVRSAQIMSRRAFQFGSLVFMRTKTEELLYVLLWAAEALSRPTWRNINESFEGCVYKTE